MEPGPVTGRSRRTSTHSRYRRPDLHPDGDRPPTGRTGTALLVLAAIMMAALLGGTPVAAATDRIPRQTGPTGGETGQDENPTDDTEAPLPPTFLTVTDQSPVVAANGSFQLEIAIQPPDLARRRPDIEDLQVAVTVFGRIVDEADVDLPPSIPINRLEPSRLGDLRPSRTGHYRLELPLRSGSGDGDRSRILLPEPGVYPITIELRGDDGIVAATRTNLIRLGSAEQEPESRPFGQRVGVSTVLTVVPAEGVTADDARRLLSDHPDAPITVLMSEGVASQLRADAELAADFARAVGDRSVITGPMVDLDPSALAEIDRQIVYERALTETWDDLRQLGLEPRTDTTVVTRQLTAAGVETLGAMGITTVIDLTSTAATNGFVESGGHRIDLLRFDSELSELLDQGTSGVLQANRLLSHLTLRAEGDTTPVVLGGPAMGQRPIDGLDVFLGWVARTDGPRLLELAESTEATIRRRLAERPNQNLAADAGLLADIETILAGYEAMYAGAGNPGEDNPGAGNGASGNDGGDAVPAAGTTPREYRIRLWSALALERNPDDRRRALLVFSEELGQELEFITLPLAQTVNMAAREGSIPLIIESRAAGNRQVMLRFRSEKFKVVQDSQLVTVQPGTSSIDVELQARSLGSSQLEVSVWTPDGTIRLATNQFQVRSTAVPGLGLLISGAALCFLTAWWVIDHRRSRRERGRGSAGGSHGDPAHSSQHDAADTDHGNRTDRDAAGADESATTARPATPAGRLGGRRLVGHR